MLLLASLTLGGMVVKAGGGWVVGWCMLVVVRENEEFSAGDRDERKSHI